jgi:hypothetical protein
MIIFWYIGYISVDEYRQPFVCSYLLANCYINTRLNNSNIQE